MSESELQCHTGTIDAVRQNAVVKVPLGTGKGNAIFTISSARTAFRGAIDNEIAFKSLKPGMSVNV